MLIRIEGVRLPGRRFDTHHNVHVGVQWRGRPAEVLEVCPGDAAAAEWTVECTAAKLVDDRLDLRGPHIEGSPGQRFIYLSWGDVDDAGAFTMFRRAKLWLDGIDAATARAALATGQLTARLELSDAQGGPLCASVRPPLVTWSAPAPTR